MKNSNQKCDPTNHNYLQIGFTQLASAKPQPSVVVCTKCGDVIKVKL